jgi:hypothetical protein
MVDTERVAQLLASGIAAGAVAEAVGCDPSYISQLTARPEFSERIAHHKANRVLANAAKDSKIEDLEQLALNKLERLLPMESNATRVAKIFQVLNSARKSNDTPTGQTTGTTVTLNLPEAATVHFKLTQDNQVIEIEGRSMVPMPSHKVAAQLRDLKAVRLLDAPVKPNFASSIVQDL